MHITIIIAFIINRWIPELGEQKFRFKWLQITDEGEYTVLKLLNGILAMKSVNFHFPKSRSAKDCYRPELNRTRCVEFTAKKKCSQFKILYLNSMNRLDFNYRFWAPKKEWKEQNLIRNVLTKCETTMHFLSPHISILNKQQWSSLMARNCYKNVI